MSETHGKPSDLVRVDRMKSVNRLRPEELKRTCPPDLFDFPSTKDLCPLETIIGQERAVKAMEFGLKMKHPGYNIFITGLVGTGRNTYARAKVQEVASEEPVPNDWCYVHNFQQPDQPVAIDLPAGTGLEFRKDMEELIEDIKVEIKKAFESEHYEKRKNEVVEKYEQQIARKWVELEEKAKAFGFTVQRTPTGIFTLPITEEGQPMGQEEFRGLSEEQREQLAQHGRELQTEISETVKHVQNLEKDAKDNLKRLEKEIALYAVGHLIEALKEKYATNPRIFQYLENVKQDVVENLDDFRTEKGEESPFQAFTRGKQQDTFTRYRVNLLVDNSQTKGAPVIVEPNPTYYNLFGKVEHRGEFGTFVTDFTMIKPGAIHLANGGYLIVQAKELLSNYFSWEALKRTLKSGKLRIENVGDLIGLIPTTTLRPEPIPVNIKVVVIGNPILYHLLHAYDEDFRKFFKIKADFDIEMDWSEKHVNDYACFISSICHRNNLRHFDPSAVAKIVEYSLRLSENQDKLSTRFNEVAEVIYEASAWAEHDESELVSARHVERALEEKIYRSNRVEEKIRELISKGTIMIDVDGIKTGQVNGIALLNLGDYTFGKPSRITARTYLGEKGIVNIERESQMSGRIHNKGVLILGAYLGGKYAQDKPLSLSASICFEQLYEEVEGDSASSTELYAILSELSNIPIDQSIAVTGSVNQKGEIQPIGGVNEKIEGFYCVCKAIGLTGRQGVMIPRKNLKNLMLKEEVIDAVRKGLFHLYAVETVDEGIEILTGVAAGVPDEEGKYPEGTVNHLVNEKLREMAESIRRFARSKEDRNEKN